MLSFQNIYEEIQEQVEDASAASLVLIKRAINQGEKKFGAVLNREWKQSEKTFSIVADQQYYQLPEDCIRPSWITVTIGDITYPLKEIADHHTWQMLNMHTHTSEVPEFYYVRGNDEFGIYPKPSSNQSSAGRLSYERRTRDMAQANFTTGTVTMTNGDATVTHSAAGFTANMVGRYLNITDGSADGMWYKIGSYTDTSNIELENTYGGSSGSGITFVIAELPDIPEEFHESLVDYGCYRYYRRRRDTGLAREMKAAFDEALVLCKAQYSSKTSSQYYRPIKLRGGYQHSRRDYRVE
jgi:hypothetical protein